MFKKIVGILVILLALDGTFDLVRVPSLQTIPGPTTPTSLKVTLDSVKIAHDQRKNYTTIFDTPTEMDVINQTVFPDNVFGVGSAINDEYKAVRFRLTQIARYTGTDPCIGDSVTDAPIQIPGNSIGNEIEINYMVPHEVLGLVAGYRQMQPFQLSGPIKFRLVFSTFDSVVCASSAEPLRTIDGNLTQIMFPQGLALYQNGNPFQDEVAVTNGSSTEPRITFHHRTDDGNTVPIRSIAGNKTGLSNPIGIYIDAANDQIGVANNGNNSITIFDRQTVLAGTDPNTTNADVFPVRTISGPNTKLNGPGMIAHYLDPLDSSKDEIVVANGGGNSVSIFDRTSVQTASLARLIGIPVSPTGPSVSVDDGDGLILQLNGDVERPIYFLVPDAPIANDGAAVAALIQKQVRALSPNVPPNLQTAYSGFTATYDGNRYTLVSGAAGLNSSVVVTGGTKAIDLGLMISSGAVETYVSDDPPQWSIDGSFPDTNLNIPCGVYVDTVNNEIGVANSGNNSITIYNLADVYNSSDGDVPPVRTLIGYRTSLNGPCGLYVDPNPIYNEIGVVNIGNNTVTIYNRQSLIDQTDPNTKVANVFPIRSITGGSTGLNNPVDVYLDTVNNEIGVANRAPSTLTFHRRDDNIVQLKAQPAMFISPQEQVMYPQYSYSGTVNRGTGVSSALDFDGYNFFWKVTNARIRQVGDVTSGLLIPPSSIVFGLTDGSFASNLPFECPILTPFITITSQTNCPPGPLIKSPFPVVEGDYRVAAILFSEVAITKLHVSPTPVLPSEIPRVHLALTIDPNDHTIQKIDWDYKNENGDPIPSPLLDSQQFQIILTRPYDDFPCPYNLVAGNNQTLGFAAGPFPPDTRNLDEIKNNQCSFSVFDVDSIVFTYSDALSENFVFTFKLI